MSNSSGLRFNAMTPGDLEGTTIGPVAHRVDRERIDAFVEATGDLPERWTDTAPPGYAAALLFSVAGVLLNDQRIRQYLATLIHVDQQFTFLGPIEQGAAIAMTGTVERVRERAGAFFVTFAATGTSNGETVLESRSTFLMSDQAAAEAATDRSEPPADERGPNAVAADRNPLEIGLVAAAPKSASRADLVRYAAATRDFNPLHWDHNTARAAGLGGVVVHGLLMFSWLAQQASAFAPGPTPITTIKVRFRSALGPAEAAHVEAIVRDVAPDGRDAQVSLKVIVNEADVVTGSAVVSLAGVTP
jgi:acyl dehydratase